MTAIAHEGNYRTASIAVTGTLDGNIFLIPIPPGPSPLEGLRPLPPAAPSNAAGDQESTGCAVPIFNQVESYQLIQDQEFPEGYLYKDTQTVVDVSSDTNCYGVLWQSGTYQGAFPMITYSIFWNIGPATGLGRTGICFLVDPATIATNATLYACILDDEAGTIRLVKWVNQSLADYGTVLASTTFTPVTNRNLRLRFQVSPQALTVIELDTDDVTELQTVFSAIADSSIPLSSTTTPNNYNCGLIAIGGGSGPGTRRWQNTTSQLSTTPSVSLLAEV